MFPNKKVATIIVDKMLGGDKPEVTEKPVKDVEIEVVSSKDMDQNDWEGHMDSDDEGEDYALEACAEDMVSALKDGDSSALKEALISFLQIASK